MLLLNYYLKFCLLYCVYYGLVYIVRDPTSRKIIGVSYILPPGLVKDG